MPRFPLNRPFVPLYCGLGERPSPYGRIFLGRENGHMKLPIFEIVKQAYGFVWAHRAEFWKLAIPAIVIVSISGVVFSWGSWAIFGKAQSFGEYLENAANPQIADFPSFFSWWLAAMTVFAIVFCMYSVAWHRLYLVPEEQVSAGAAYRWGGRQWRFLFNYVTVFSVTIPLLLATVVVVAIVAGRIDIVVASGGEEPSKGLIFAAAIIAPVLVYLPVGWVYARLSMLFPSTAADAHVTLDEGWRFSKGNGWRLLWIIVFVALPVGIVTWSVNSAASFLLYETGAISSLTANLLTALLGQFFGFIGIAVGVSALSISYKRLMDAQDAQAAQPAGAAEGLGE